MSNANVLSSRKAKSVLSVKVQALAAAVSVIAAVALPQLLHAIGAVSGLGTSLGEAFLPMHLPIITVGLLAGPYAGAVAGLMSPLISFAISGMPTAAMLPFMMIELCIYGLVSGLLINSKMPVIAKIVIAQVSGRAVRAVAILIAFYGFSYVSIPVAVIWNSIITGLFGLVLQWTIIPLFVYRVKGAQNNAS